MSRFENGGLERVQCNIAPVLVQRGIDVSIVAGKFAENSRKMIAQEVKQLEISSNGKYAFARNLLYSLRRHRPDIVMTTSNDVGCMTVIFCRLFFPKIKVIWTQHSSISGPLKQAKGFRYLRLAAEYQLMRIVLSRADAVVSVSKALADDIKKCFNFRKKIFVIHNPVVMPNYPVLMNSVVAWPWKDKLLPTLIFVGRLVRGKRLDLLLKALVKINQDLPVRLIIVGDGPEKKGIVEWIKNSDLNEKCRLVGYQENPLPLIKKAHVLILPSDYEGFGNVLVEAMACGTQVISTDCPDGPSEILERGRFGQLVLPDSVPHLVQAILKVISGEFVVPPSMLTRRAKEFSLAKASKSYVSVIQFVLKK